MYSTSACTVFVWHEFVYAHNPLSHLIMVMIHGELSRVCQTLLLVCPCWSAPDKHEQPYMLNQYTQMKYYQMEQKTITRLMCPAGKTNISMLVGEGIRAHVHTPCHR